MAISPKQLPFFLTLALLSIFHTHARDSQFFNKVPTTTANQQQEPDFLPEDENNYGLYGHESGQLPPIATAIAAAPGPAPEGAYDGAAAPSPTYLGSEQPLPNFLPKNYNPVAYVTVPEGTDNSENDSYKPNNNGNDNSIGNYNNDNEEIYFNSQQLEQETAYRSYPTTVGGGRYNNYDRNLATGFRPEGMSDTRALENGKFYYDVESGRFSSGHPYESLRENRRNYYGSGAGEESSGFSTEVFENGEKYNTP